MQRVQRVIRDIYHEESPEALRAKGVAVYEDYAEFVDPHTLLLSRGERLTARRFVIATGARPLVPPGFASAPHLTTKTLFALRSCPSHLVIVGAGPVGTEMAQAFARLGSRVTLIGRQPHILPRADPKAAALLMDILRAEGIEIMNGVAALNAEGTASGVCVHLADGRSVGGDALLIATGKVPNIERLKLDAAGVKTEAGRIVLDDRLRTSQRHILAAGDVTGGPQFTHYAGWQGFTAVRNALLPPLSGRGLRASTPWAVFTDPEVAQAGLTEAQARAQFGDRVQITELPMTRADRAMTDGTAAGFMKLVHRADGRLLGATIIGWSAAEMINDWQALIEKGGRILDTAGIMRVYPTLGTANVILATEQIDRQLAAGRLGSALRLLVRLFR